MVYRAKITKIMSWVVSNYNTEVINFVRDKKDWYIEVKDEDEAELLENINQLEEQQLKLKNHWKEKYGQ